MYLDAFMCFKCSQIWDGANKSLSGFFYKQYKCTLTKQLRQITLQCDCFMVDERVILWEYIH